VKSIVLHAPHDIRVEELPPDNTFSVMATMRVISSGICAADSYLWSGDHPWNISYPIVPGHELFGELIAVADEIKESYPVGSKVAVQVLVPCYACAMCEKEIFNMCTKRAHFGSTFKGAFAETVAIPHGARMHRFRDAIDEAVGGLSETMANAIYCAKRAGISGQDSVLILGMGSIGACLTHYLLKTYPQMKITVLTSSPEKLSLVKELGAHGTTLEVLGRSDESFDAVFEVSGLEKNMHAGVQVLKPRGTLMIYGVFKKSNLFDFNQIGEFKELQVIGGHLADDESFDASVEFLSTHQRTLKSLVSKVVNFSNFTSAFDPKTGSEFKFIFQPGMENSDGR